MGNVKADSPIITAKVSDLEEAIATMRTVIGQVETEVAETGAGKWSGSAKDAFAAAAAVWYDESLDLNARLDDLKTAAHDGKLALERMESENEDAFKGGHTNLNKV